MRATTQHRTNRPHQAVGKHTDQTYINTKVAGSTGAFSDPRIILASPHDLRLARVFQPDSEHCQFEQQDDGPTYLVIGPNATDESLLRAGERFGIPVSDLIEFRTANQDADLLPIWQPVLEIGTPDGCSTFEVLGDPVPKQDAWKVAEDAADNREDIVSVIVRIKR